MKFFSAIAALAVAAVASAQTPVFTDCSGGTAEMTLTSLTLSPYPLCVGATVCATLTGSLSAPVTAPASLAITGRYLGRVVYTDNVDLCTVLGEAGLPCPVASTVTSVTACITVKANAPTGIPVVLRLEATNGNGNVLFCQEATVTAQVC